MGIDAGMVHDLRMGYSEAIGTGADRDANKTEALERATCCAHSAQC